jgi:hypothetical protein
MAKRIDWVKVEKFLEENGWEITGLGIRKRIAENHISEGFITSELLSDDSAFLQIMQRMTRDTIKTSDGRPGNKAEQTSKCAICGGEMKGNLGTICPKCAFLNN